MNPAIILKNSIDEANVKTQYDTKMDALIGDIAELKSIVIIQAKQIAMLHKLQETSNEALLELQRDLTDAIEQFGDVQDELDSVKEDLDIANSYVVDQL